MENGADEADCANTDQADGDRTLCSNAEYIHQNGHGQNSPAAADEPKGEANCDRTDMSNPISQLTVSPCFLASLLESD